jgi:hAT family C-terminal dimerisation region
MLRFYYQIRVRGKGQRGIEAEGKEGILAYWQRNSMRWPYLSRLALDALSVPAMSAECEHCFSSAKNLITSPRNGLKPDTIEASECQRHWMMNGCI